MCRFAGNTGGEEALNEAQGWHLVITALRSQRAIVLLADTYILNKLEELCLTRLYLLVELFECPSGSNNTIIPRLPRVRFNWGSNTQAQPGAACGTSVLRAELRREAGLPPHGESLTYKYTGKGIILSLCPEVIKIAVCPWFREILSSTLAHPAPLATWTSQEPTT
jgi:hypothetical protein